MNVLRKLTKAREEEHEEGFTLIELMIVVVIIGILAAIAIPIFTNVQNNAADAALKSDVKNTDTQVASKLVKDPNSSDVAATVGATSGQPLTADQIDALGLPNSDKDSTLTITGSALGGYVIRGQNSRTKSCYQIDSQAGKGVTDCDYTAPSDASGGTPGDGNTGGDSGPGSGSNATCLDGCYGSNDGQFGQYRFSSARTKGAPHVDMASTISFTVGTDGSLSYTTDNAGPIQEFDPDSGDFTPVSGVLTMTNMYGENQSKSFKIDIVFVDGEIKSMTSSIPVEALGSPLDTTDVTFVQSDGTVWRSLA